MHWPVGNLTFSGTVPCYFACRAPLTICIWSSHRTIRTKDENNCLLSLSKRACAANRFRTLISGLLNWKSLSLSLFKLLVSFYTFSSLFKCPGSDMAPWLVSGANCPGCQVLPAGSAVDLEMRLGAHPQTRKPASMPSSNGGIIFAFPYRWLLFMGISSSSFSWHFSGIAPRQWVLFP